MDLRHVPATPDRRRQAAATVGRSLLDDADLLLLFDDALCAHGRLVGARTSPPTTAPRRAVGSRSSNRAVSEPASATGTGTNAATGTLQWLLRAEPMAPEQRRVWEALTCLSDGTFGVTDLGEAGGSPSRRAHVAAGVFDHRGDVPELLHGPVWTSFELRPATGWTEIVQLDQRDGVLTVTLRHSDVVGDVRVRRWVSIADPGIAVQIIEGPADAIAPGSELVRPPNAPPQVLDRPNDLGTERVVDARSGRGIVVSARDDDMRRGDQRQIVRYVSAAVFNGPQDRPATAVRRDDARQRGHRDLERRHRTAWRARWARCGTSIGGEPDLDRGVRFATFQLLAHGGSPSTDGTDDRELAIGARGVTGRSYKGHVFWDTDVFVVPALSSIAPHAAGAALRYRWNRLGPAMEAARAEGRWGARFPWESAHSGIDVTPRWGTDLHGRSIPIHTGELEIHIVGDIAWALDNHRRWTGDDRFMHRYGRTMLVESARYWASRIEVDDDGSAHIRDVIGPDEYHEHVDDNVFTNVVAGYNLRLAGRSTGVGEVDDAERTSWFALADALADGWDPVRGVHEQFTGFFELDPVMVDTIGRPPLSADALLGRERIQQTQVVKQPDVLMAHHLMPGEMRAGTLHADLDTYLPRTAAGSSLAPAICASLLFEAGRADEAVEWFDLAARLDLDDLTGTTAGGLHLATIGGLWQAVTIGVLGLRPAGTALRFEPHVPEQFGIVRHRFGFRGAIVTATVDGDDATVEATRELDISCGGESRSSSRHRMRRTGGAWTHR